MFAANNSQNLSNFFSRSTFRLFTLLCSLIQSRVINQLRHLTVFARWIRERHKPHKCKEAIKNEWRFPRDK